MFAILVPTGFSLTLVLSMRNIFIIPKFGGNKSVPARKGRRKYWFLKEEFCLLGFLFPFRFNPFLGSSRAVQKLRST